MSFDIEEVDSPKLTRSQWLLMMARASGKSLGAIILEEEKRKETEEFWSDPCWAEP